MTGIRLFAGFDDDPSKKRENSENCGQQKQDTPGESDAGLHGLFRISQRIPGGAATNTTPRAFAKETEKQQTEPEFLCHKSLEPCNGDCCLSSV